MAIMTDQDTMTLAKWQDGLTDRDRAYLALREIDGAIDRLYEMLQSREGVKMVRRELPTIIKLKSRMADLVDDVRPGLVGAAE